MAYILLQAFLAGLGTCLGAIVVLMIGSMKEGALAALLGFASGVMVAVVITDLLPTSLVYGSLFICSLGFAIGFLLVTGMDFWLAKIMPGRQGKHMYLRMGYLIALGISMHDLPEGIAIAAGYSASAQLGPVLALAIGLHNIPEGMAVAAPLKTGGTSNKHIISMSGLISLITPLGALLGIMIMQVSPVANSFLLALAAGAMVFIIAEKLIPTALSNHGLFALLGTAIGFWFMLRVNSFF